MAPVHTDSDALVLTFSICVFVPLAGVHAVQVHRAASARRHVVSWWLFVLQAALAVVLLILGGWLWHGATGLLASAALVVLPARLGRWTTVTLTAAIVSLSALLSLSWGQFLHWLCCHVVVVGIIWFLACLADSLQAHKQAVQRSEQVRISADIHDILGRTITGIAFQGQLLHKMSSGHPELQDEVQNLLSLTRGARSEIRSAASSSWSTSLDEEFALARALLDDASMDVTADVQPCTLPDDVERALALALREAVTNILVHSKATEVRFSLRKIDAAVTMSVYNDGAAGEPMSWGMGLKGISDRCQAFNGGMDVEFMPPEYFLLTCYMRVE